MNTKRSVKGILIENIIKSFLEDNLYENVNKIRINMQKKLRSNLEFETVVSKFELKNGHFFGHISFNDENNEKKLLHITVSNNKI